MAGLLDWVKEKAKQQYQQGLLNQVINDPASIGRELGQLFDPAYMSQVKPMTQEGALDVALSAPMMLGTLKAIPAKESLWDVANSNFNYGIPSGNKTVKINSLKGMMSSSSDDLNKVNDLVSKISSPNGYIERLIVDNNGNVIEGQHRLNALKKLGINDVPVSVIDDMSDAFEAVKNTGLRNENARQIIQNAFDMKKEAGSVKKALDMYEIPSQYKSAYEAAFKYLK